jgi:predicted nucleotidyltransferase component of viral defense system
MMLDAKHHKEILVKILREIATDEFAPGLLGFKGGTAAMLFYNLSRFSVDLDFDLLDPSKEQYIFDVISKIISKYGTIKESYNKRYSLFFLLSYEQKMPNAQNIKIDINKRDFGSRYEIQDYLGTNIKVMVQEDMAAHKLVAMFERMGDANRDIYDVWYFLQNSWPINKAIIEQRTDLTYKAFLQKCIDDLGALSDRGILAGIGELLTEKQKVWAKAYLRKETIFLLRLQLSHEDSNPE